ncbi:non-homologous end joining protein Ku [Ferruginibacter albus]|uniref:non-homologous end joining protein Ku n=1 Tax=Ferruginibacter albus TaxID=2875540 RepID=UPI001CC708B4|nr:Ku protein [Ferruginibacter albus]UAY53320.1 Ku protein [Ferruginibacter albus]
MRPIWTGAIGFGLVNIPVKLFSATKDSELNLDMLDKKDLSNIRYMRVNEKTGKEVNWENIVKGYKVNDRYVVLTDKDFESANAIKTKIISIEDFVNATEIDSVYFETPYYLAPDKSGEKAYSLLHEALQKTGKVGVATFVMRSKESLAVLRPSNNIILLNRLRFAEEIRDTSEIEPPRSSTVKPGELKMAISLINQLSHRFNIKEYKDTYTAQLLKIIKAKAKGKVTKEPQLKVVHNSTKDLMSQLKASLSPKRKKVS